ncbi:hypothetical protein [Nitrospira sp. M1]
MSNYIEYKDFFHYDYRGTYIASSQADTQVKREDSDESGLFVVSE